MAKIALWVHTVTAYSPELDQDIQGLVAAFKAQNKAHPGRRLYRVSPFGPIPAATVTADYPDFSGFVACGCGAGSCFHSKAASTAADLETAQMGDRLTWPPVPAVSQNFC
jgi:hypothetical protein